MYFIQAHVVIYTHTYAKQRELSANTLPNSAFWPDSHTSCWAGDTFTFDHVDRVRQLLLKMHVFLMPSLVRDRQQHFLANNHCMQNDGIITFLVHLCVYSRSLYVCQCVSVPLHPVIKLHPSFICCVNLSSLTSICWSIISTFLTQLSIHPFTQRFVALLFCLSVCTCPSDRFHICVCLFLQSVYKSVLLSAFLLVSLSIQKMNLLVCQLPAFIYKHQFSVFINILFLQHQNAF